MSHINNYKLKYKTFIESRRHRPLKAEKGYEIHHILPRSLGGRDTIANKVKLTCREHFIAHRMLAKMYRGQKKAKMLYAINRMMTPARCKITSRTYQLLKEEWIEQMKKDWKDPKGARRQAHKKIGPKIKKLWDDKDYREKLSQSHIAYYQNNKEEYSNRMKERWKNPDLRKKVMDARKKLYATDEYKAKRTDIIKKMWADPETRKKIIKGRWS